MLVLSRRQHEEIIIGDGISIRVISVQGGRVKLGIEAPKSVRIKRTVMTRPPNITRDHDDCRVS